jgi:hypothetical protein
VVLGDAEVLRGVVRDVDGGDVVVLELNDGRELRVSVSASTSASSTSSISSS